MTEPFRVYVEMDISTPADRERFLVENERARNTAWRDAFNHWLNIGYSYNTARALAAVKHGADEDVRAWALNIMRTKTNLRYEDMI